MKWYEVGVSCDGYITVERFKTEQEAREYEETAAEGCYTEYLGLVDSEAPGFFNEIEEN